MLCKEFANSLNTCIVLGKYERWEKAIESLETDPLFKEISLKENLEDVKGEELVKVATSLYKRMSSGHSIVLLTITKLIEKVEEKTLVLIDEPECHLHPPLLSAFTRTLSEILISRNGVAIIATHSPVILQEVPKSCVWKLRRTGLQAKAERPEIETFGENVGVLTREVFGLEVTESGFHQLLKAAVDEGEGYEEVLESFDNEVGTEAKGIVRVLLVNKNQNGEF